MKLDLRCLLEEGLGEAGRFWGSSFKRPEMVWSWDHGVAYHDIYHRKVTGAWVRARGYVRLDRCLDKESS